MKLLIDFTGDNKGYELKQNLQIDIHTDSISLGYISEVLFQTSIFLRDFIRKTDPKHHAFIGLGISKSLADKIKENNPNYPFTTIVVKDEI